MVGDSGLMIKCLQTHYQYNNNYNLNNDFKLIDYR